jgi:hypothetical protein
MLRMCKIVESKTIRLLCFDQEIRESESAMIDLCFVLFIVCVDLFLLWMENFGFKQVSTGLFTDLICSL